MTIEETRETFPVGRIVRLRSSGDCLMTVEEIEHKIDGQIFVHTVWFDENKTVRRERFSPDVLVVVRRLLIAH